MRYLRLASLLVFLQLFALLSVAGEPSCYERYWEIEKGILQGDAPVVLKAAHTNIPIAHAAEKEGLFFSDIAMWFDSIDAKAVRDDMLDRLKLEANNMRPRELQNFLENYPTMYRGTQATDFDLGMWQSLSAEEKVNWLTREADPKIVLGRINNDGWDLLFESEVAHYKALKSSDITPHNVSVGNDAEGYEIKTAEGVVNLVAYREWRATVEAGLEGKIGHQHSIHSWPADPALRAQMAPQYIELIDAGSWFLYFRQMNRNPNHVDSLLTHPYLGVYTRTQLDRLADVVIKGEPERFKDRFRTIAAKNFKPMPGQDAGAFKSLPSCELRSGNKGACRDFMTDMLDARISTGDYSGLRPYNSYEFDAASSLEQLFSPYLKQPEQMSVVKRFENEFQIPGTHFDIQHNTHPLATNHIRSRFMAPLLPWEKRLNIDYKLEVLNRARERYAKGYAEIAASYFKKLPNATSPTALGELRRETVEKLERLNWLFSKRVRLDLDFQKYLMPRPVELPSISVANSGPIDVNKIDLGLEFSFRFNEHPSTKTQAARIIGEAADRLCKYFGCNPAKDIERLTEGGHGHGLSVRYLVTDKNGLKWRVEWDGIKRNYNAEGQAVSPRGGHIEVPTPRFAPDSLAEVESLYAAMRESGNYPSRHAGGAHFNFDIEFLQAMEPKIGAGKMANFIRFFEENKLMLQFLWQHPSRVRVAIPYNVTESFAKRMNAFDGDWDELGKVLYEEKYFNPYVGRKPAYMQNNVTGLMENHVPEEYRKTIDIKSPLSEWFPSFTGKSGRAELRMMDAPTDEYMAALMIKFGRAMMNRAFNGAPINLAAKFTEADFSAWRQDPALFFRAAEKFLSEDLGLSAEEFRPLLVESYLIQSGKEVKLQDLKEFEFPQKATADELDSYLDIRVLPSSLPPWRQGSPWAVAQATAASTSKTPPVMVFFSKPSTLRTLASTTCLT